MAKFLPKTFFTKKSSAVRLGRWFVGCWARRWFSSPSLETWSLCRWVWLAERGILVCYIFRRRIVQRPRSDPRSSLHSAQRKASRQRTCPTFGLPIGRRTCEWRKRRLCKSRFVTVWLFLRLSPVFVCGVRCARRRCRPFSSAIRLRVRRRNFQLLLLRLHFRDRSRVPPVGKFRVSHFQRHCHFAQMSRPKQWARFCVVLTGVKTLATMIL